MPFASLAQSRLFFSGGAGKKMQKAAPEWASKTDYKHLPKRVKKIKKKKQSYLGG